MVRPPNAAAYAHLKKARPYSGITVQQQTGGLLGLVQPVSSKFVADNYGIALQPTFNGTVYDTANMDTYFGYLQQLGVGFVRGRYDPNSANSMAFAARCRTFGIKWMMLVAPESSTAPTTYTPAQSAAVVADIAQNYPDICAGLEGLNEPNQNRGGSNPAAPVPDNWAQITSDHQKAIWTAAQGTPLQGLPILGPSLHDTACYDSYDKPANQLVGFGGQYHYLQLVQAGILPYQTAQGIHRYPGGYPPTNVLDQRLAYLYAANGAGYPVWITETGYHNALGTNTGSKPTDEASAGIYGPRAIMELVAQRGLTMTRYELLDDVDTASPKFNTESNYGLYRVDQTIGTAGWTPKPEAAKIAAMTSLLVDPGPAYTPAKVPLLVGIGASDVQYVVTGRRDGTARVWLWRSARVWDPVNRASIPSGLTASDSVIIDRMGARNISVGADVVSMPLR